MPEKRINESKQLNGKVGLVFTVRSLMIDGQTGYFVASMRNTLAG